MDSWYVAVNVLDCKRHPIHRGETRGVHPRIDVDVGKQSGSEPSGLAINNCEPWRLRDPNVNVTSDRSIDLI